MNNRERLSDKEVTKFISRGKEWMGIEEEKNEQQRKTKCDEQF